MTTAFRWMHSAFSKGYAASLTARLASPRLWCRAVNANPCLRDYPGEPGYYFNVRSDLSNSQPAGFTWGQKKQVPSCARYAACCGDTYVWVTDQDMPALSQFTLVLLHVAHQVLFQAYYPFPDMIAVPAGGKNLVVSCANARH